MAMCASLLSWKANGMLEWVKARQLKWQVGYFLIFLTHSNIPLAFQLNKLKVIPRKKGAPRIFAHYHKIFNFCPIFMKLGGNDQLMS